MADGAFIPTTRIFDISTIYSMEPTSKEFKDFLVQLYQTINDISIMTNLKDTGNYITTEFITGQHFFEDPTLSSLTAATPIRRSVFRKVINFGQLPNNAVKNVAHGIAPTATFSFTRIYAVASNTTGLTYLPIPFSSTVAANIIELSANNTNVVITTHSNRTNYNICYVILEYIKS